uniref:Uncharacterized protein n=1 Tax=Arion vulgaris TaxID=1028688 RepID=A0A0B7BH51_9EUPU
MKNPHLNSFAATTLAINFLRFLSHTTLKRGTTGINDSAFMMSVMSILLSLATDAVSANILLPHVMGETTQRIAVQICTLLP